MIHSISTLKKEWDEFKRLRNAETYPNIKIEQSRTAIYAGNEVKIYIPTPTGFDAHLDNSFVRCIMGPYGSGKSTWAINEMVRRACDMPKWSYGGRRRSRWAVVRNTTGELVSTTLQTWLGWFDSLGDIYKRQKPILTYEHTFNDGHGIVELEILFMPLDKPEQVRKIKSLELTGAYINEMCEVPKAVLEHMTGRVGRYPSREQCPEPYWHGIIGDTNAPDSDHWIPKDFETKRISGYRLFKQPPALLKDSHGDWIVNQDADNVKNLPSDDYYLKLAGGKSQEFIKVFCLGQYGTVGTGKLVYPEFNPDLHAVEHLEAIQGEPLYIGWDFGLTPACVVCQLSARGQLRVLKEYVAEDMGIRTFAEAVVIPGLKRDFPYCKVGKSVGDPAGMARSDIMEEMSCIGELCSLGIETVAAQTNDIDPRLGSVRFFLNRMVDGKPCFVLDKTQCPMLFKGFVKDYVYNRIAVVGEERYKDKPNKNMASHSMDALGYDCLELASDRVAKEKMGDHKPVDMWNPVMRTM